jgi:hypothetical protein
VFRWLLSHPWAFWVFATLAGAVVGGIAGTTIVRLCGQRERRGEGAAPYRDIEYPRPYRTGENRYCDPQRWGDRFK